MPAVKPLDLVAEGFRHVSPWHASRCQTFVRVIAHISAGRPMSSTLAIGH
jgi:hypothetical protein